jgi:lipopolysaccharide export system protein LptA
MSLWRSLLVLVGIGAVAQAATPSRDPLVLDGADNFVVSGQGARVELTGNVRFHRGDVKFFSRVAIWDRAIDQVRFEGNFRLEHPAGKLTADVGRYERASGSATAEGNAVLLDSSGEVSVRAGWIRYDRRARVAEASMNPVFQRITRDSAHSDTVRILANQLTWREVDSVAEANGNVRISRGELQATCGRARLDQKNRRISLNESPVTTFGKRNLLGKTMWLDVDFKKERIDRVTVYQDAVGNLVGDPDSAGVISSARVKGDTLIAEVDGDVMRSLLVARKARTESWDSRDSTRRDRLEGDSLRMFFDQGKMSSAWVAGNARSLQNWVEKGRTKGVNDVKGKVIRISFANGRLKRVRVEGKIQGVYNGTERKRRPE